LEFDPAAFEDLAWWVEQDRNKALRIINLIKDVQRDPFKGIGKPEPLKRDLAGCWSRRIDQGPCLSVSLLTYSPPPRLVSNIVFTLRTL
jgi:Txe/YoeB family toxin of toxin-antitoxin system